MTIRLGLVGAGTIGQKHAEAATACGIELAGIVDQDSQTAARVASPCGARVVASAEELFADASIDGVIISVPNFLHKPLAIQALEAGKDVLLEKPMGLDAAECDQINAAAAQAQRIVQVGFAHRYTAVGQEAKAIAMSGKLGTIYHAKAALYLRRSVPGLGGWFTTKSKSGGGALIDVGVHLIDLAMHVMAFPRPSHVIGQVYSTFGRRMKDYIYESMWAGPPNLDGVCDVEDAAHALFRFENGATLDINVAWAGNFPDGSLPESLMGFFGDQAGMTFALFGDRLKLATEEGGRNVDVHVKLPMCDQLQEQIKGFADAIKSRQVTGADGQQGRIVQSLIDAVYQSSEVGQPINLS